MSKLFYTAAILLLTSPVSAVDMDSDPKISSIYLSGNKKELKEVPILLCDPAKLKRSKRDRRVKSEDRSTSKKPSGLDLYEPDLRIVYDEHARDKSKIKKHRKINGKNRYLIRNKNRHIKNLYLGLQHATEFDSDEEQTAASTYEYDNKAYDSLHLTVGAEDVTSLFDFALSNLSGRRRTYEWTDEENATYIQNCFDMLWDMHAKYAGQLPGVAQILLGDIWPIANHAQENEIISLLDNQYPSFSEEDVAALLAGIGNDNPLDVISIKNIEDYCALNDPIVLYTTLLKSFTKDRVGVLSKDEESDLTEILNLIDRDYESLDPEERLEIKAKLNIMVIFQSGLTEKYAAMTNYEEYIQRLSNEIERGEKSTRDAANSLYQQLKDDEALEYEIQTCVGLLDDEGFQSYNWIDDGDESEIYSQDGSNESWHTASADDNASQGSESADDYDTDAEASPPSATNN